MGVSDFSVFTAFKAKDGVSPVLTKMMKKGDEASVRLTGGFAKAKAGVMALKTAVVGLAAGIAAVGAFVPLKAFADWEKGILSVQTLMSSGEIEKYGQKLKDISKETIKMGFSVEDTNKGLFDTISALGASEKSFEVYKQSAVLAKAGCTELSIAIDGMTSILNAYGKEQTDATAVANAFFTAQKKGKTTVAELAANVGQVAPIAKAAGVSFEEMMSSMAALTLGGMSTDKAATGLKATLSALVKPSKEAEETLRAFGVPVGLTELKAKGLAYTLQKLIELQKKSPDAIASAIPNVKALTGVLALNEEKMKVVHETLGMIQSDIKNGTGLNEAFKTMGASGAATMAQVMGKMQVALITLGEVVAPYLLPLVSAFGDFVDLLAELSPKLKIVLDGFVKFGTVLSDVYHFVKDNWLPLLLTMPLVITGVRVAIDILRLKMALLKMEGGLMAVVMNTKVMTALTGMTAAVWKSVAAFAAQAAAFMMTPWGIAIMAIMAIIGVVILLYKNWDKVKETISSWWATTKTALSEFWAKCKEVFGKVGAFIKEHFVDILLTALGPVGVIISAVKNLPALLSRIKNGSNGIKLETESDGKNPADNSKVETKPGKGKIAVDVNLTNKTDKNASVTTDLESPNNLDLQPGK